MIISSAMSKAVNIRANIQNVICTDVVSIIDTAARVGSKILDDPGLTSDLCNHPSGLPCKIYNRDSPEHHILKPAFPYKLIF
jgi:hypothetical protein